MKRDGPERRCSGPSHLGIERSPARKFNVARGRFGQWLGDRRPHTACGLSFHFAHVGCGSGIAAEQHAELKSLASRHVHRAHQVGGLVVFRQQVATLIDLLGVARRLVGDADALSDLDTAPRIVSAFAGLGGA